MSEYKRINDLIATDSSLISVAYELYKSRIRHFIYKRVGDIGADDVTSNTFLCLLVSHTKFDNTKSKFTTWLHTIAYNECLKWIINDAKYDRCDAIKQHLSGNESMSVYRRYAGIDSNVSHHVQSMMRRDDSVSLQKLDAAKYFIRMHQDKFPVFNIILKKYGDITYVEVAKMLDSKKWAISAKIDKERALLNIAINARTVIQKVKPVKIHPEPEPIKIQKCEMRCQNARAYLAANRKQI